MENRPAMLAEFARLLMINSGPLLVSAAASFIIAAPATAAPGYALLAFLLFLLGVSMVMLALAAERFPAAASLAAATASALSRYLLGGGN